MNCRNCGKENQDGTAFCIGCGKALTAPASQMNDGPTTVFTTPKKRNIAAMALGLLSVLLATALALSLTGVFGAASGPASVASKSFSTPEDAIKYFVDHLKAGDFEGALGACAAEEMAKGFDYKAYAKWLQALPTLGVTYLPSEYPQYIRYNANKASQQLLLQMTCFSISFSLSEENAGIINGVMTPLQDGKIPEGLIEEFDPKTLSGLELIDTGKVSLHDNERNREMQKRRAKVFGADDLQSRIVLYRYDGNYYIGGFTVIEYNGRWLIQDMSDTLAGTDVFGTPMPVSDKSEYYNMLEQE